ncbi:hypothetical protein BFW01_g7409 [Lasiodiplodia theobromae]|uniref:NmrA-like domain-containing protein n=1 Tax=Lasiodiplodia theobromae TaxID=45133 RepID=A0A5N5D0E6_9PEZI|nr:hypothetical protein DBV05_g10197 [Lasiodiplodia theobromae]KAF9636513.1 hypothetical protein BFW01_g7409 [Lasiodiplodia theobromae]
MLILIAGVTGNLGQKLVHSLASRGHQVRGLGRSPEKLALETRNLLESFVQYSTYYDIPALDRACDGVDAVICAYGMIPVLQLDGQLLLLRAAERAGVKRFVADSWNHDWRDAPLGHHESYDPYLSFRRQAELSSDIKPIYIFNGVFAETLFSIPDHGHFGFNDSNIWDSDHGRIKIWGTGHQPFYWTTERDAAEFTAEIVQRDDAEQGGFWNVCSGAHSLREIAGLYEQERQKKVTIQVMGTVGELRERSLKERAQGDKRHFETYIGWSYQYHAIGGTWIFHKLDNDKLNVQPTSLAAFLKEHPEL